MEMCVKILQHSETTVLFKFQKSAYRISERQIDFNLYKAHEGIWWQRLTKRKVKLSWLRTDFDRWRNEDDPPSEEEDRKKGNFERYIYT